MKQTDGALRLDWRGITIDVSITFDWLNMDHHHIEFRADQPLPVTQTGYRSHFIHVDQFAAFNNLEQLVRLWLEDAAKSPEWIQAQDERRQLKLF